MKNKIIFRIFSASILSVLFFFIYLLMGVTGLTFSNKNVIPKAEASFLGDIGKFFGAIGNATVVPITYPISKVNNFLNPPDKIVHVYTGECRLFGKGYKCIEDKGPKPPEPAPGCTVKMGPAGYYQQCDVPPSAQSADGAKCSEKGRSACDASSKCKWIAHTADSAGCVSKSSGTPRAPARDNPVGSGGGSAGGSSQQVPPPPPKDDLKCTQKQPAAGECQVSSTDGGVCKMKDAKEGKFEKGLCEVNPAEMCCVPIPPTVDLALKPQDIPPNTAVQTPVRTADVKLHDVKDSGDPAVKSLEAKLTYDSATGTFKNSKFDLGTLPKDDYQIVMQVDKYLDVLLENKTGGNVFTLGPGLKGESLPMDGVAGDIAPRPKGDKDPSGDNIIDIHDFNLMSDCMSATPTPLCPDKKLADLNDDGKTDEVDMAILLKNFGKVGFELQGSGFTCQTDPACKSGQSNLQLCPALCTKKTLRR